MGLLQSIPVGEPFSKIGIDYLGPFPKTRRGNVHILVATDYCTRYVELVSVPTATAEEVASFLLYRIVLRHGAPREFLSDRGAAFRANITTALLKMLRIKKLSTTSYHPQCNGLTERFNRTLADMLSMYVNDTHTDWDDYAAHAAFAYNTSWQESVKNTPFFLVYGRNAVLPMDVVLLPSMPNNVNRRLQQIAEPLVTARQNARKCLEDSQRRSAKRYNDKHRPVKLTVGQKVWRFVPYRKVGLAEKLLHRWRGPYELLAQTSPVNFRVRHLVTGAEDVVHVSQLKMAHDFSSNAQASSSSAGLRESSSSESEMTDWSDSSPEGRQRDPVA